jgi:hypothetical protein
LLFFSYSGSEGTVKIINQVRLPGDTNKVEGRDIGSCRGHAQNRGQEARSDVTEHDRGHGARRDVTARAQKAEKRNQTEVTEDGLEKNVKDDLTH